MHERVGLDGHFALPDLLADVLQLLAGGLLVVIAPLREVELVAPLRHVVHQEKGHWCDGAVPRPSRLVRVAVAARSVEDRLHLGGHLHVHLHARRRIDGRVGPFGPHELERDDYEEQDAEAAKRQPAD